MKTYKLNMTRPEFLNKILTDCDDDHVITDKDIKKIMGSHTPIHYCAYTCMMNANIDASDIVAVNEDEESIAVKLTSKELVKTVVEKCNKEIVRTGSTAYKVRVKADKTYFIVSIEELPEEDEDT